MTWSSTATRGLTEPRRPLGELGGFGSLAFSTPLGLSAGRPFSPLSRAISARWAATVCSSAATLPSSSRTSAFSSVGESASRSPGGATLPGNQRQAPRGSKIRAAATGFAAGTIVIFKTLVLQALYNLSDDQLEYQIRDRLSFMRFLGLGLADRVPDATTVWLYREKLAQAGLVEALFDAFDASLKSRGYLAMGGHIVDASIVSAPVQRNSREENKAIKDGDPPVAWKPNKKAQKDVDARWTKKDDKSYFGYKNHVNIDRKHKLMRRYTVTDAAVHDSQQLEAILDPSNTASDVWADTAYRSKESEEKLADKGLRSRIHRRASRGKPLSQRAQEANRTRSKVRSRVEHVFGHQHTSMGGTIVRTIGLIRAKAKIGLMNLVYNISRLAFLERTATPA